MKPQANTTNERLTRRYTHRGEDCALHARVVVEWENDRAIRIVGGEVEDWSPRPEDCSTEPLTEEDWKREILAALNGEESEWEV